jgi:hypothetical protein
MRRDAYPPDLLQVKVIRIDGRDCLAWIVLITAKFRTEYDLAE